MSEAEKAGESAHGSHPGASAPFNAALATYVKALQKIQEDSQRSQAESYLKYARATQEAWSQSDPAKHVQTAYSNYLNEVLEAASPARAAETQKRIREAYYAYVGNAKDAWAGVDVSKLDVPSLAYIGQSLTTAACYSAWAYRG
jgi:hypothetical protein